MIPTLEQSPIQIEKIAYRNWANCWRAANQQIELVVTADVGPRIIYFGRIGGHNLFKNYADQMGGTGEASWMIRGGSRIWVAPEDRVASYAPDNEPVEIEIRGNSLIATAPVEDTTRVQKQMVIRIAERDCTVEVLHRVRNTGLLPAEFAVWVLTVMAQGGTAVTGFPPRGTHPKDLAPSNPLIMWPFTDLSDPRWRFLKKYLVLQQDPARSSPQKIGHFHTRTWAAYFLGGDLFLKHTAADPRRTYPDIGSSFEMFTNGDMLELETLGPLCRVNPGEWIEHTEHWALYQMPAPAVWSDDELDHVLGPVLH